MLQCTGVNAIEDVVQVSVHVGFPEREDLMRVLTTEQPECSFDSSRSWVIGILKKNYAVVAVIMPSQMLDNAAMLQLCTYIAQEWVDKGNKLDFYARIKFLLKERFRVDESLSIVLKNGKSLKI